MVNIVDETLGLSSGEEGQNDFEKAAKAIEDANKEEIKEEDETERGLPGMIDNLKENGFDELSLGHLPFCPGPKAGLPFRPNTHDDWLKF